MSIASTLSGVISKLKTHLAAGGSKAHRWLSSTAWAGVGVLLGVIALFGLPSCEDPPPSFAAVSLTLKEKEGAFFSGRWEDLPRPPEYPIEYVTDHCGLWSEWMMNTPQIYFDAEFELAVDSGEKDFVVVDAVEVTVLHRRRVTEGTAITCKYGGDLELGYHIYVDSVTGKTTGVHIVSDADVREFEMPPASIQVKGEGHELAYLTIESQAGYLYEGVLKVSAKVNHQTRTYELGSTSNPLRWLGGGSSNLEVDSYDWHPLENRWVDNFDARKVLEESGWGQQPDPSQS